MAVQRRGLGWIPDLPDARDHLYAAAPATLASLPSQVDMRPQCPGVYDQGQLGSCTGNAIAGAIEFDQMRQHLGAPCPFTPSRLFIYYNERVMEHTVNSDAGAQIRDGIKSVAKQGDCPESEWPYNIPNFAERPPGQCYADALKYRAVQYASVPRLLNQMKGCLASGLPFVFGFTVYDSFMSDAVAQTGEVPMPNLSTEQVQGGHAVGAVGYDDTQQRFIVRNSWGTGWGMQGYFTMPYAYLLDPQLASDFWRITLVAG
ncbi:MAG TPA: C1 family peptidase [Chloroflexota bacterium]|nr:C1 family peptidase [Chloroflexota bacterium]